MESDSHTPSHDLGPTELVGRPGESYLEKLNNVQGSRFNRSAIALGNNSIPTSPDVLALLMMQQQTEMTNADHDKATFNLPQKEAGTGQDRYNGRDAARFFSSFSRPGSKSDTGVNMYSWNISSGDAVRAFAENRVAMMVGYPYQKKSLERINPDLQYSVAPVPQLGEKDPVNYASYWPEVVWKDSKYQAEAWDFIRFVSDRNQLSVYLDTTSRVSPRTDVRGPGELNAFYEQNASATTWYKGKAAEADQIFRDMIRRLLEGEDIARAIDAAAEQVTTELQDVKKRFPPPQ